MVFTFINGRFVSTARGHIPVRLTGATSMMVTQPIIHKMLTHIWSNTFQSYA